MKKGNIWYDIIPLITLTHLHQPRKEIIQVQTSMDSVYTFMWNCGSLTLKKSMYLFVRKYLKQNTNYSAICAFTAYLKVYKIILFCRIYIKLIREQCVKVGAAFSNWEQMASRRSLYSDQYFLTYFLIFLFYFTADLCWLKHHLNNTIKILKTL